MLNFRRFLLGCIDLGACFAVTVGATFLLFGLLDIFSAQRFLWTALESEVTVIHNEEKESEHNALYRPTFAVMGNDGSNIEYVGTRWVYPKPHERGEVVKGYYERKTGIIVSELMFRNEAEFGTLQAKFGATYFLIGAVFLWWRRQRRLKTI